MCLRDLLKRLRREAVEATESKVRWAIVSGKIDRPPLDGSLRFDFDERHVDQLMKLFRAKREAGVS